MDLMTVYVLVAAAATVYMLVSGIVSMVQGGEDGVRNSTVLMFKRVGLQGLTAVLLLLALLTNLK